MRCASSSPDSGRQVGPKGGKRRPGGRRVSGPRTTGKRLLTHAPCADLNTPELPHVPDTRRDTRTRTWPCPPRTKPGPPPLASRLGALVWPWVLEGWAAWSNWVIVQVSPSQTLRGLSRGPVGTWATWRKPGLQPEGRRRPGPTCSDPAAFSWRFSTELAVCSAKTRSVHL